MVERVVVDGSPLEPRKVVDVAERRAEAVPATDLDDRMAAARAVVEQAVADGLTVYGVTTGFGALAEERIPPEQSEELQVSLLRSHAAGVGDPLPDSIVRAMLLLRARTLAQGHSGVRPAIVRRYLDFLRLDLLPLVPSQGSVGASGDLAQFAHLALPIIGEGSLKDGLQVLPAVDALQRHALEPISLKAKEGLSLLNGTEGMLALGVLGLHQARRLVAVSDLACALSVEALLATDRAFQPALHRLRPHPGQIASADNLVRLLNGSEIVAGHRDDPHAVQDAYSVRCAPQVHGSVGDVLDHCEQVFRRELGSVVDNPIVLPETGEVVSGGNFHGQPLAFSLDFMAMGVTELSGISERRTDRMLDPQRSAGLPAFLASRPGLNSGYMLAQYTAAALVAENRVLSHPASIDTIPTSGSQEDHVSMGWGAGRKLWQVLENTSRVLAVELLCGAQGTELRRGAPGTGTKAVLARLRSEVPPLLEDRPLQGEIETVAGLVRNGSLIEAAEGVIGALA